jgi:hypothetical protein
MSAFGAEKRHQVTITVRGPKTTKQTKAYMKRIRAILRGLPGTIETQKVVGARRPRRRAAKRSKRRRKPR